MEARDLLKARPHPYQLALRIRHPSMDPAAISHELRLVAEHSFKAGEPRKSSSGLAATSVHAESYWLATLNPTAWPTALSSFDMSFPGRPRLALGQERLQAMISDSLGAALAICTTHFLRSHAEFVRRIQSEGGAITFIVEVAPKALNGFTLTPQTARALSDMGIAVEFEFANG
ncbi:MAG TPA: hypothetical protein VGO53_09870 [Steroidobacteraceae bacterium]|jgi:hypothetical protein|nr:hypothetical protein [Steroidobacteraceae bacterium]